MSGKPLSPKDVGPKTAKERQDEFRDRQRELGRKGRLHYHTDAEEAAYKRWIDALRSTEP